MAKYNSGSKYNFTMATGGAKYNSARFFILVKIFETLHADDDLGQLVVKNIFREKVNVLDEIAQAAIYGFNEKFIFEDKIQAIPLVILSEKFGVKDEMIDIIVSLYLKEKAGMLDELKQLNTIITQVEKTKIKEIADIDALISIADKAQLKEAAKILAALKQYEYAKATDRKPRKAISDFLIGNVDGLDAAWEYVMPLEMKFDINASNIPVMPASKSTYIEMPYVDGNMWEDTVYENRLFNIVCWSADGLSTAQKEQLKFDITRFLDSTKHKTKRLTLQKSNIAFDVKYTGSSETKEGPTFITTSLQLESQPYGYPLFNQEVFGNGLLTNNGDKEAGIINEISGGCINPEFTMGAIAYKWNGQVPINAKLIIDHEALSCYLEDNSGNKTQALDKLIGDFQSIPVGSTIQIDANESTKDYIRTVVNEHILWGKA